ncbi:30S ribosomal protein S6 [Defluviitalea saccharophila]|jgi:small subunit ribosomal protein S6|uniref:Small ribosomal subunit protein bS6 n=1 Tax=Defluviitalea saccharophila TaxID=879970 RepID=A0ABZ2Y0Q9_9FIRM|nr:30S ribosomal protein S6 [Candidatus Epulonipiscium sp.]
MNKYELAVVFSPNLDEEAKNAALEKVQGYITRFGGTVEKVDEWGKRKLAYEIAKVNEGFYYFITFTADASAPAEIESRIRIMDAVLRYMITRIEE